MTPFKGEIAEWRDEINNPDRDKKKEAVKKGALHGQYHLHTSSRSSDMHSYRRDDYWEGCFHALHRCCKLHAD